MGTGGSGEMKGARNYVKSLILGVQKTMIDTALRYDEQIRVVRHLAATFLWLRESLFLITLVNMRY